MTAEKVVTSRNAIREATEGVEAAPETGEDGAAAPEAEAEIVIIIIIGADLDLAAGTEARRNGGPVRGRGQGRGHARHRDPDDIIIIITAENTKRSRNGATTTITAKNLSVIPKRGKNTGNADREAAVGDFHSATLIK